MYRLLEYLRTGRTALCLHKVPQLQCSGPLDRCHNSDQTTVGGIVELLWSRPGTRAHVSHQRGAKIVATALKKPAAAMPRPTVVKPFVRPIRFQNEEAASGVDSKTASSLGQTKVGRAVLFARLLSTVPQLKPPTLLFSERKKKTI
jgi:hypothetical protein